MRKNEAIQVLRREIEWCVSHPDATLSTDFQRGFVGGLRQAITILDSFGLAIRAQGWRETDAAGGGDERV